MGGPSNIDEVELFLRNMFSDPNILPVNPLFRKLIKTIIVKKRLHEAQENYQAIGGKSPLLEITNELARKIEQKSKIECHPVMRYVPPFAKSVLKNLQAKGVEELILLPMYPHYSTTTTKSSLDDIKEACKALNFTPKMTTVKEYYNNDSFIEIQSKLIIEALGEQDPSSKKLIISAHGLPLSIIEAGDPYQKYIEENVELLEKRLLEKGVHFKDVQLAYQSKVGNGTWLEPNLSDILRNPSSLDVLIFPIAFTIDNSETIFELDIENREIADKIGYNSYDVTKCPNSSDEFSNFLAHLVQDALVN
jgi:ferrochelatase